MTTEIIPRYEAASGAPNFAQQKAGRSTKICLRQKTIRSWDRLLARCVATCILCLFLLCSSGLLLPCRSNAFEPNHVNNQARIGPPVSEFDLGGFCWGADHNDDSHMSEGRFGHVEVSADSRDTFVYLLSSSRAEIGRFGDLTLCKNETALYTKKRDGRFLRKDLTEAEFLDYKQRLVEYRHKNTTRYEDGLPDGDYSIGGCLFPLLWYKLGSKEYTMISIVGAGSVAQPVVPKSGAEGPGVDACDAWGAARIAQYKIVSDGISAFLLDPDQYFIELTAYQQGYEFDIGRSIQCVASNDAFKMHVLVERSFFDRQIRPTVMKRIREADTSRERSTVPFAVSYRINSEIASDVLKLSVAKGCKS